MDEDLGAVSWKDDVWGSWKIAAKKTEQETHSMQQGAHRNLRLRVASADAGHQGESIDHDVKGCHGKWSRDRQQAKPTRAILIFGMLPPLLRMAIKAGSLETIKSALEQGLDPNLQDNKGYSLLMNAIKEGQLQICQLLLLNGANPELKSDVGTSAVDLAAIHDESNMLQLRTSRESKDLLYEQQIEDDDWVAEEAPSLPSSDHCVVIEAHERQAQFSRWNVIDNDDSWDDIEISLPDSADIDRLKNPVIQAILSLASMSEQYGVIDPLIISDTIDSICSEDYAASDLFIKIEYILAARGVAIEECLSNGYSWDEFLPKPEAFGAEFLEFAELTLSRKMSSIQLFLKELSKTHPIPKEEEQVLFKQLSSGSDWQSVRDRIILSNLRFAYKTGAAFAKDSRGVSAEDRISEAAIGLITAIDRFNVELDYKFITYAVHWIRQKVQKCIYDNERNIRIPPNKLLLLNRFRKAVDKLGGNINAALQTGEFRDQSEELLKLHLLADEVSLESLIDDGCDSDAEYSFERSNIATTPQEQEFESIELRRSLKKLLNIALTTRESTVVKMYFGIDCDKESTFDEIGHTMNVTRERVRQIANTSLNKLLKNRYARENLMPLLSSGGAVE